MAHSVYTPGHFDASDATFCHAVIRAFPFGVLVVDGTASHLPFLIEPDAGGLGTLVAHVARPNPHADAVARGADALAIFTGPHGYVSPTWYQTAPAVPTWNYCVVHARGKLRELPDTAAYLDRLAAAFDPSWRLAAQPADYQARMLPGIVAFALPVDAFEGKAKLSQNRSDADREGVIAALEQSQAESDRVLARWMRRLVPS